MLQSLGMPKRFLSNFVVIMVVKKPRFLVLFYICGRRKSVLLIMTLYKSFGLPELVLVGLFLLLYLLYFMRVTRASKLLGKPAPSLLFKFLVRSAALGLIILALLGPSFGETTKELKSVGKDIFFAVDLSQSMNAFDIAPSRLEKIKYELKNIVNAFSSDKIGLIMFSNEAFTQCPLTYDKSAVTLFIETLSTSLVPNRGTDFGPPLMTALDKLNSEDSKGSATKQSSKIIILISDGEDFGERTKKIAEKVKERDIKLFTLGIGTKKGSKIPVRGGFKRNNGVEVVSKLNPSSLKNLASTTGGKYFEISENRNDVSRLISAIDNIEGELRDAKRLDASANKYFYFLALAVLLLVLDLMFSTKTIRI